MESDGLQQWRIRCNEELRTGSSATIRAAVDELHSNLNPEDDRRAISIAYGDPSSFPCFRTTPAAEDAVIDALRSAAFNGYSPSHGLPSARRAIAEYLSRDLPYKLSSDDVHLTLGCNHAIEIALTAIASPGVNILLPRPCYPDYESQARFHKLEFRHFDLLPGKEWEVDLDSIQAVADENTIAMVIINPGNPCGNVYSHHHLKEVAETARKHGIAIIADEVYSGLSFGRNPFVPMGTFGSLTPVITLGSISKQWIVPGWRLGWLVMTDPNEILKKQGLIECIKGYCNITSSPPTLIQGAIPQILEKTNEDFFSGIMDTLRKCVEIFHTKIKEIPCMTSPFKPQGGMSTMVKLEPSMLNGIKDDIDFCNKLAKEESVMILPGVAMGMKNWLHVTFAIEPTLLDEAFERIKAFYQKHAKK